MQRPKLRPTRTVIIAGSVTLLLGAGTAVAAAAVMSGSPVSSSGVIDACWTNAEVNGSHVIVLQDQGTTCPKGTTPISWNQSGPSGPAGPAGPSGPSGPAGASGPAGSPGVNGSPGTGAVVADSAPASACPNGGITVTDGGGNIGYVCNGADGSPGPSGLAGPSGPSGPAGPSGPSGPAGPPGAAGTGSLVGSACTFPGGATGTIQLSVAANGSISLTCQNPNCTHTTGEQGRTGPLVSYTDCNDPLGTPGDSSTYTGTMAADAAQAYAADVGGHVEPSAKCDGDPFPNVAVVDVLDSNLAVVNVITWTWQGPNAGYTVASGNSSAVCPTSADQAWN